MKRFLDTFNLVGVIALAILCAAQWRINRSTNLNLQAAQKTQIEQAVKIQDQEKTIQGQQADLDHFRSDLVSAKGSLKEAETRGGDIDRKYRSVVAERDQLRAALAKWEEAVRTRDAQLKEAGTNLQELARVRDEAIQKHNDVAKRLNQLVAEMNRAATNTAAAK